MLWDHLVNVNQMTPELQLMRWQRCMLTREFRDVNTTLLAWDFILGGVYTQYMQHNQHVVRESLEECDFTASPGRLGHTQPARYKDIF